LELVGAERIELRASAGASASAGPLRV
jgi:hypothetical protein